MLDEHIESRDQVIEVELNIIVCCGLDRSVNDDITTGIDDTEDGIRTTEVYTYYVGLFHLVVIVYCEVSYSSYISKDKCFP